MKSVPLITGGLSFLLSACSGGGGSFDVDDVSNPSSSKPRYQDDTSSSRTKSKLENLSIPSLGGGMKLVAQNIHPQSSREPSLLNDYSVLTDPSLIMKDVKDNNKNNDTPTDSTDKPQAPNSTKNHHGQQYVYSGLYYIQSWDLKDYPKNKWYSGFYGYAYYFGNKTASALPVGGVATYKGTWSFITATENRKHYSLFSNARGQAYSKRSAIPEDIDLEVKNNENREKGLVSEFSADFGTKKLKGELFYTQRKTGNQAYEKKKLYDINADIYSNRFRGKVTPTESTSNDHPFTKEGTLEGGFYGPNGEELGGKFLAGDKKVFGVFSAKETPQNPELSRETLIDGKLTTFSTKKTDAKTNATTSTAANTTTDTTANTITDAENFKTKDISSFGEADYLLIDKYPIPLLPENSGDFISSKHHKVGDKTYQVEACCSNLSYVKFGMYYEDKSTTEEKDKEKQTTKDKEKQTVATTNTYYQFLLGHRTPSSQIPKEGSAKYHGNWFGYISDGKTSYSATGDKQQNNNAPAEFTVDFGNKKLTGELKRAGTQNTVFSIEATFKNGNAFEGTARANNVVIDSQNTQATSKVNFTATVNGAFYGPNATELGGYFTYNGKNPADKNSESSSAVSSPSNSPNARAAVVFGAKRQVETNKK
ncbi:transferrin-binding protein-like solute binding protein [Haemophilus influenzae]|uniref:transferrin-binding protein-like solute binding protein n=1 Tax=Haemophilus influenzae TaxID=727 RepID=UPI000DD30374|nr:transferrin-binding protein-like solute binding protein [Haemophilus influenzae]